MNRANIEPYLLNDMYNKGKEAASGEDKSNWWKGKPSENTIALEY